MKTKGNFILGCRLHGYAGCGFRGLKNINKWHIYKICVYTTFFIEEGSVLYSYSLWKITSGNIHFVVIEALA